MRAARKGKTRAGIGFFALFLTSTGTSSLRVACQAVYAPKPRAPAPKARRRRGEDIDEGGEKRREKTRRAGAERKNEGWMERASLDHGPA